MKELEAVMKKKEGKKLRRHKTGGHKKKGRNYSYKFVLFFVNTYQTLCDTSN